MAVSHPETVSRLCVDCGLCCSGALFDHADIAAHELAFARAIGLDAEPAADGARFALPCRYLSGSACSRYGETRPGICSAFFCELALRLDEGGIDEIPAQELVTQAKALVTQLAPLFLSGEGWIAARRRWRAMGSAPPPDADTARFLLLMTALNLLFDRHFRRQDRGQTRFAMGNKG